MRINREDLLNQLESVQPGLSPKEIVEQSSCFVFKEGVVMTFNDEIACSRETPLKFTGAVSAAPLVSLLQKLNVDDVELEVGQGELLISKKNRKSGIRMEAEILLPIESVERPEHWRKLPEDFAEAIDMVRQCAGKDETAFVATCVNIHPKWVEACDSYHMTRYKLKTGVERPILVRSSSVKHIVSLGMTEVCETETWIHFKNPAGLVLSCRRYLDEYPDLAPWLEVEGTHTVLPKGLSEAADKAEIFSAENAENNLVLIELRKGKLRIRGESSSGWYSEVKLLKYEGEPVQFKIPPKLLIQITDKHNECEINGQRRTLKVNSGKFIYVTCLTIPDEEKNGQEPEEEDAE